MRISFYLKFTIISLAFLITIPNTETVSADLEYNIGAPYYNPSDNNSNNEITPYSSLEGNTNSINSPPQSDKVLNDDITPNTTNTINNNTFNSMFNNSTNNDTYNKKYNISNNNTLGDNIKYSESNNKNQLYEIVNIRNLLSSNPDYTHSEIISRNYITGHFSNYYYKNISCYATIKYINILDEFHLIIKNTKDTFSERYKKRKCKILNTSFEASIGGTEGGMELVFDRVGQSIINAYMIQDKDFTITIEKNDGLEDIDFTFYEFTINSFGFNNLYTIIHS